MARDRTKWDWWFNTSPGPKLWVQGSSTAQALPAPAFQDVRPEACESTPAQSVTSDEATTVHENRETEEPYPAMPGGGIHPSTSHEDDYLVVHGPDHVYEMIMNYASGVTTPRTSNAADWGSGSGHSLATTFELVEKSQSLSDMLRETGAWVPSLPPRFLSNCQRDYPISSFWRVTRVTLSRPASSPPGCFTTLYSASLCIVEPLSKSMPLLHECQERSDLSYDDDN